MKTLLLATLALLSSSLFAQGPTDRQMKRFDRQVSSAKDAPVINLILLGDTFSTLVECPGCEAMSPKLNDDTDPNWPSDETSIFSPPAIAGHFGKWTYTGLFSGSIEITNISAETYDGECELINYICSERVSDTDAYSCTTYVLISLAVNGDGNFSMFGKNFQGRLNGGPSFHTLYLDGENPGCGSGYETFLEWSDDSTDPTYDPPTGTGLVFAGTLVPAGNIKIEVGCDPCDGN